MSNERRRGRDRRRPGRPLFLRLRVNRLPAGVTRGQLIDRLLEGIEEQDYWLPSGWDVTLQWRNKEDAPWREDPWPVAMSESAANGRGFDMAVSKYLEGQRHRRSVMGPPPPVKEPNKGLQDIQDTLRRMRESGKLDKPTKG